MVTSNHEINTLVWYILNVFKLCYINIIIIYGLHLMRGALRVT